MLQPKKHIFKLFWHIFLSSSASSLVLCFLAFEPLCLAYSERLTASHICGLVSHAVDGTCCLPWWGGSSDVCWQRSLHSISLAAIGHPATCYLNSMKLFKILSARYHSTKWDASLGPSRIAVLEDFKATALTTQLHGWILTYSINY